MKEKKINNPLTMIGIFAGLSETAGSIVLPLLNSNIQSIFIWYVMGLPVILILLFFTTLNFNPNALYAPSDFIDEKNYMKTLEIKRKTRTNMDALSEVIDKTSKEVDATITEITIENKTRGEELGRIFAENLNLLKRKIVETKSANLENDNEISLYEKYDGKFLVLNALAINGALTIDEICNYTLINPRIAKRLISILIKSNKIELIEDCGICKYALTNSIKS